jgi:alpha/beta superfamily hydrolase
MRLHEIPGPQGRLDAILEEPSGGAVRAAVVFAHPHPQYGGTMHTKVVYQAAKAFGRIGCAALRFNFRGAGTSAGSFTNGPGEMDDFRAAVDFMRTRYPEAPIWTGGMSFGGWIGLTAGAQDPRVTALVGIALPVSRYDFAPVECSTKAKFIIHGERDELCPLRTVREFYARCQEPKELVVIDAADHLFDGKVSEVADAIEDLLGDWVG